MTPFELDIGAQGDALRGTIAHYADSGAADLLAASRLAGDGPVAFIAMGSSLSAAYPAAAILGATRRAMVLEAGELLHYGMDGLPEGTLAVTISQSGRSAETLAVAQRLRERTGIHVVAVTNDPASPMTAWSPAPRPGRCPQGPRRPSWTPSRRTPPSRMRPRRPSPASPRWRSSRAARRWRRRIMARSSARRPSRWRRSRSRVAPSATARWRSRVPRSVP